MATKTIPKNDSREIKHHDGHMIDDLDLIVCNACCCYNQMLYFNFPNCIGCYGKHDLCCFEVEKCLKPGTPPIFCWDLPGKVLCI